MRGFRSSLFVIIFFILAGLLGFGVQKLLGLILPDNLFATVAHVYTLGVNALSLNFNLCGIIGLILSYIIVSYLLKK